MNVRIEAQRPHSQWVRVGGLVVSEGAMSQVIGQTLTKHSQQSNYPAGTRFRAVDETSGRMLDIL